MWHSECHLCAPLQTDLHVMFNKMSLDCIHILCLHSPSVILKCLFLRACNDHFMKIAYLFLWQNEWNKTLNNNSACCKFHRLYSIRKCFKKFICLILASAGGWRKCVPFSWYLFYLYCNVDITFIVSWLCSILGICWCNPRASTLVVYNKISSKEQVFLFWFL